MTTEDALIQQLVEARRSGSRDVDPAPYASLDRPAAYRVQHGVMVALGEKPGLYKTGVTADGIGTVAPIFASAFGQSGSFRLSQASVIGVEVEVAVVLGRDVPNGTEEVDLVEAIAHYVVGVEICGQRYLDRGAAGPNGGLADGMSALGYVVNPTPRDSGADVDNFDVVVEFAGQGIYSAPAKHGFGRVLESIAAYAKAQLPEYPLRAGMMVTTGSLCGLVPTTGAGRVVAQLGTHKVEFDIV